jgi:hypothetical protein
MASQNRRPRKPSRTTKLNAQDRVILFCAAIGIDHGATRPAQRPCVWSAVVFRRRITGAPFFARIVGSHHRVVDLDQRQLQFR